MAFYKKESGSNSENKDYKARFEFVLTTRNAQTGEKNIICQRYFKIMGFNPLCTHSSRLSDSIIRCAKMINKDLNEKSAIYTALMAPKVFNTVEEMENYFADGKHAGDMTPGEGIVIREQEAANYVWSAKGPIVCPTKFNKYEFAHTLTEDDKVEFCFEFKDNGRTVIEYTWSNILPRTVKNSIDLSNKYGKSDTESVMTLNGDAWVLYKMVEGRADLVNKIIRDICATCCVEDAKYYTDADPFGEEITIQASR